MVVEHPPHEQARAGALVDAEAGAELVLQEVARPYPTPEKATMACTPPRYTRESAPVPEAEEAASSRAGRQRPGRVRRWPAPGSPRRRRGGGGLHGVVDAAQRRAIAQPVRRRSGRVGSNITPVGTRQPASKMALPCALSMRATPASPVISACANPVGTASCGTERRIRSALLAARASKASTDTEEEEEEEEEEDATSVASCAIKGGQASRGPAPHPSNGDHPIAAGGLGQLTRLEQTRLSSALLHTKRYRTPAHQRLAFSGGVPLLAREKQGALESGKRLSLVEVLFTMGCHRFARQHEGLSRGQVVQARRNAFHKTDVGLDPESHAGRQRRKRRRRKGPNHPHTRDERNFDGDDAH